MEDILWTIYYQLQCLSEEADTPKLDESFHKAMVSVLDVIEVNKRGD